MNEHNHSTRGYGWIPDVPDHRDHHFAAAPRILSSLPKDVDLRQNCPHEIYDQGRLGSCTANAIAAAIEFDRIKEGLNVFTPSRLFIYYNERSMEGTINSDAGASIRDGIKSVNVQGACPEQDWPYDVSKFAMKPSTQAYAIAKNHEVVSYQRVHQTLNQMKGCLAAGYPFVFGFAVYESFESRAVAQSGHAPMPGPGDSRLGGHAVLAVGYEDENGWFIVRNSWGATWGLGGYFTLPYAYLLSTDLADDFWTIRVVR